MMPESVRSAAARNTVLSSNACGTAAAWPGVADGVAEEDANERHADGVADLLHGNSTLATAPTCCGVAPIARRIPGPVYYVLPGTPHMMSLEKPDLVA